MRYQPNRNYKSEDRVMTPDALAAAIVAHFRPTGKILEPCRGSGAFLRAMPGADWCEIEADPPRDFLAYDGPHVDWICTNPPWSLARAFLAKGMEIADNVVFLFSVNHAWTKARVRDVEEAGFHRAEIAIVDPYPMAFPASGFQLGCVHFKRGPSPGFTRDSKIVWTDPDAVPAKTRRRRTSTRAS